MFHPRSLHRGGRFAAALFGLALCAGPGLAGATLDVPGTYATIQAALDAAAPGDTVLVQPGTYAEYDLSFGGKDLVLKSASGAELTTIDAGGLGRVLLFTNGETLAATVEGFTLRGGRAPNGADAPDEVPGFPGEHGGGVLIDLAPPSTPSSATFRGCIFLDNQAGSGGKGGQGGQGYPGTSSYPGGKGGQGSIGGWGGNGGAIASFWGSLVVEDCRFEDNRAGTGGEGGKGGRGGNGYSGPFGTGTSAGNGGTGGDGGAIAAYYAGDVKVVGCALFANASGLGGPGGAGGQGGSGGTGGGHTGSPGATGLSGDGGALSVDSIPVELLSNTFAKNTIDNGNGGGALVANVGSLRNCLLWANDQPTILGAITASYSDVEGGFAGVGNIDADPLFADLAAGDLHLTTGSACLHKGDPDPTGLPAFDIDGDPRIVGTATDIGCDEALWELMGTGEDFLLELFVNGLGEPYDTPEPALQGDLITARFHSPGGTFVGSEPWFVMQAFTTGSILSPDPFNPGLMVDTTMPGLVLVIFKPGPLGPWLLPAEGITAAFVVPPGLVGTSVRFQAIALSPLAANGVYATTDALDLELQ